MKIGVTSQNFRTITGHAGKARRFMVFEVAADGQVTQSDRFDLPKDMSMHEYSCCAAHPIDGLDVLITGGCGDGFVRRMAGRGIKVIVTSETDPMKAVSAVAAGAELAPPPPGAHDDDGPDDDCGHDHGQCHDHDHGHGHGHDHGGCGCSCSSKGRH